jgi:hypothetical protein
MTLMNYTKISGPSRRTFSAWLIAMLVAMAPARCPAHKQIVHEAMSKSASLSSDGLQSFLGVCLGSPEYGFHQLKT